MFEGCNFCPGSSDVHLVKTDNKGENLIFIKNNTHDDNVRVSVSDLNTLGDASALEKYYHGACYIYAERSCESNESKESDRHIQHVCDCEIVVFVREALLVCDKI